ncbi:Syntaxin-10 [Quaeritorhiza haematococci]|nr:Syntaxin-10 [Quaeritorhiza haematococci]
MAVSNATQLYQNWKRLLSSDASLALSLSSSDKTGTGGGPFGSGVVGVGGVAEEFKWTTDELIEALKNIDVDLQDLEATIHILSLNHINILHSEVESNPNRFRLQPGEMSQRKDFIEQTRRTVFDMRAAIANAHRSPPPNKGPSATASPAAQSRNALLATSNNPRARSTSNTRHDDYQQSNQRFIDREQAQQQLLMTRQDEQLDGVLSTVVNLKDVAEVMGNELDMQTRLLGDMEERVDQTGGKLEEGMKRMKDFIKANADTKQIWTIACLIIVLIILLVLVFTF